MIDILDPEWDRMPRLEVTGTATAIERGWSIPTNAGRLLLTAYAAGIFRLQVGDVDLPDYGILIAAPDTPPDVVATENDDGWTVSSQGSALSINRDGRFALDRGDRTILTSSTDGRFGERSRLPSVARLDCTQWFASLALGTGDAVYGLGEKWGRLNRRGQLVMSWAADPQGATAEASTKNSPFAWSPRGWGVFVHTPGKVVHGVGFAQWSLRSYGLVIDDGVLDLFFMAGADGTEILERYTVLTGRPSTPPLWSLGAWHNIGNDELAREAGRLRTDGVAGDVLALAQSVQIKPGDHKNAHDQDLRLCEWDTPWVSLDDPLHDELAAKKWLLRDGSTGNPYRHRIDKHCADGGLIDFTHPDAFAYWRDRQRERMAAGADVLASGFVGPIAENAVAFNGDDGLRLHNVYSLLHNRCLFEAAENRGVGNSVVFGQAGWAGSQRFPVQRGGDPDADWEGLAASLRGGLSWGLSGGPCYAATLADNLSDERVYVRWIQAATFCSHLYLQHLTSGQPVEFGSQTKTIVQRFIELRYQLLPYIEGTLAECTATGLPAMRAMPLAFPTESEGWAFDTQYMFGPDLLIVPVVTPDGRVRAYIPKGTWVDFWTDEHVEGGRRLDLSVPDDHIPVFVREGAVLPFGPSVLHTDELGGRTRIKRLVVYGEPRHAPCLAKHSINVLGDRLSGVPENVVVERIGAP